MTALSLEGRRGRRLLPVAATVLLAFTVAGCSSVPDWANPIAWAEGAFSDDDLSTDTGGSAVVERLEPRREQAEEGAYPSLATVPERPSDVTPPEERQQIVDQLIGDRANARYTAPLVPRPEEATPPPPAEAQPGEAAGNPRTGANLE